MGRSSRTRDRRPGVDRASAQDLHATDSGTGPAPAPSLASATLPRVWQGVGYRPLPEPARARPLFEFAALPWPAGEVALAWGAWTAAAEGERLVGALAAERSGRAALFHGPVVLTADGPDDPLEVAGQLVAAGLDHAAALGAVTVFARPQSLDRVWVRFGFIPVPEVALPPALAGRTGAGLYAWRGGSALWTLRDTAGA
ncbi:MAG TPA: hypothetical protein VFX28_21190 [Methylomirabilota bacterium]|nr:hypothetical protein [Methylomirabilota bacterium]